jgi:hypothetical protein
MASVIHSKAEGDTVIWLRRTGELFTSSAAALTLQPNTPKSNSAPLAIHQTQLLLTASRLEVALRSVAAKGEEGQQRLAKVKNDVRDLAIEGFRFRSSRLQSARLWSIEKPW